MSVEGRAEFNLLGPLEVRANGHEVQIGGFTRRAALGFLLLNANRVVSISELTSALWPSDHPPTARGILLNVVSALRKALPPEAELRTHKPGYVLRVDPDLIDLHRFRATLTRPARHPAEVAANLREALALWRGPALADLGVEWPALVEIENSRGVVLEDRFDAELACGRHREVLPELEAAVREQPLRERLHGQLMLALYRSGRQADALAAYRAARARFVEELGIEPGRDLGELEQAILAQDPSLTAVLEPVEEQPVLATVERKRVSVLIVRLTDTGDGDEVLTAGISRIRAEVERFGGVVTGVLGSMVCAAFGAPRTREDDAVRAVRAAYAVANRGATAAVATGTALVSARAEVSGRLLDRCMRMAHDAEPGAVALCDVTRAACATEPRGESPFVGRATEVAQLHGLFEQVRGRGQPHLVTLLGTPGVGKSRLLTEFGENCLVGRTPTFGRDAALAALADIVRAFAGVHDDDAPSAAQAKLTAAVHALVPDDEQRAWLCANLLSLIGIGEQTSGEVLAAWRKLVEEIAARGPVTIVVEDVHWADDTLLDFVHDLADDADPVPLLVIVTARPELLERRPGWGGGKRNAATISLDPLSEEDTSLLVDWLLTRHGVSGTVPLDRIGGNPLFAQEYVRMLRDGAGVVPDTVQTVIAARLDTLPPLEKAVLQDAAVLDGMIRPEAVAAVGERDLAVVERCLAFLRQRDFLRRVLGEYSFGHVLVRDVAYDQIPKGLKAHKHYHAACWVQTLPLEHAPLLAHHFNEAVHLAQAAGNPCSVLGQHARAALSEAGRKATAMAARDTAIRCFQGALDVCPSDHPDRPDLLLRHGVSLTWSGAGDDVLLEASAALLAAGDRAGAAEAELALWRVARHRGDHETSHQHLDRMLALLDYAGPSARLPQVRGQAARTLAVMGRCMEAIMLARAALSVRLRPDHRATALEALGIARVKLGDPGGLDDLQTAIDTLRRGGMSPALALYNLGAAVGLVGDAERRRIAREQARSAAERFGDSYTLAWLDATYYIDHYWAGEYAEAIASLDRAIDADPGNPTYPAMRGRVRLVVEDVPGATADADAAVSLARQTVDRDALQDPLALQARLALMGGEVEQAREIVSELLPLFDGRCVKSMIGMDLPIVLAGTGHDAGALDHAAPSRWRAAAQAFLSGEPLAAADIYARIGSLPDETQARAHAAIAAGEAM